MQDLNPAFGPEDASVGALHRRNLTNNRVTSTQNRENPHGLTHDVPSAFQPKTNYMLKC
jgi:hypothetical protein